MHEYFDYTQAAKKAGLPPADLDRLKRHVEDIYPSQMLREMHLYEICTRIGHGELTLSEALAPPAAGQLPDLSNLRLGG